MIPANIYTVLITSIFLSGILQPIVSRELFSGLFIPSHFIRAVISGMLISTLIYFMHRDFLNVK